MSSISGLVTWIESASENSFDSAEQTDGSYVTNYDLNPHSLSKNNFTAAASDTTRLIYKENYFNGLPAMAFDGMKGVLFTPTLNSTNDFSSSSIHTIFTFDKNTRTQSIYVDAALDVPQTNSNPFPTIARLQ